MIEAILGAFVSAILVNGVYYLAKSRGWLR
jgi:hypothetical protein